MINFQLSNTVVKKTEKLPNVLECTDLPNCHWAIEVGNWKVFANVNQSIFEPSVLVRKDRVFIGVEEAISVFDLYTGEEIFNLNDIAFVQWIEDSSPDFVVFSADVEVIIFNNSGELLWRQGFAGHINMTEVHGDHLLISTDTEGLFKISLTNGSSII